MRGLQLADLAGSRGCQEILHYTRAVRFVLLFPLLFAASVSAQDIAMRQAAGTSQNPAYAPMSMLHAMHGEWMLMLHGQAFLTRVTQSGPRGGDGQTFSTNWVMGSASRPLGGGTLLL